MSEPNGNDRISVSRDALRAELSSLKLDLIQSLASKAEVDRLSERVGVIELHGSPSLTMVKDEQNEIERRVHELEIELRDRPQQVKEHDAMKFDVESLKGWRNRIIGAGGVISLVFGSVLAHLAGAF